MIPFLKKKKPVDVTNDEWGFDSTVTVKKTGLQLSAMENMFELGTKTGQDFEKRLALVKVMKVMNEVGTKRGAQLAFATDDTAGIFLTKIYAALNGKK